MQEVAFAQICEEEGVVPVPILSNLKDSVLNLDNYSMNAGICKALGKCFEHHSTGIRKV